MRVLKLSAHGLPQSWITLEEAVLEYAADDVRWTMGSSVAVFHGGHNARTGQQSVIEVHSIIGTRGVPRINPHSLKPGLNNGKLFARDRNMCAYCGKTFQPENLTREHIVPICQNGQNTWMNLVTACRLSPPKSLLATSPHRIFIYKSTALTKHLASNALALGLPVRRGVVAQTPNE